MFEAPVTVDGRGHLLGRLASVVAKELLGGQKVVVVRCEQITISGSREYPVSLSSCSVGAFTLGPSHHACLRFILRSGDDLIVSCVANRNPRASWLDVCLAYMGKINVWGRNLGGMVWFVLTDRVPPPVRTRKLCTARGLLWRGEFSCYGSPIVPCRCYLSRTCQLSYFLSTAASRRVQRERRTETPLQPLLMYQIHAYHVQSRPGRFIRRSVLVEIDTLHPCRLAVVRNKVKYMQFKKKRHNTNPKRGPYHFRSPARIFWRTVREPCHVLYYLHYPLVYTYRDCSQRLTGSKYLPHICACQQTKYHKG